MDPSLIEAGKDLYGGPWQTFRHVTLPHTIQGVLAGSVLVFLPAVGDFVSASLLGGPEEVMIGNLIQQQFQASDNWPFGAALTVVMMTFLLIWMSALPALRRARDQGSTGVSTTADTKATPTRPTEPRSRRAGAAEQAPEGLRPPALPQVLHRPLLPRPVRADRRW